MAFRTPQSPSSSPGPSGVPHIDDDQLFQLVISSHFDLHAACAATGLTPYDFTIWAAQPHIQARFNKLIEQADQEFREAAERLRPFVIEKLRELNARRAPLPALPRDQAEIHRFAMQELRALLHNGFDERSEAAREHALEGGADSELESWDDHPDDDVDDWEDEEEDRELDKWLHRYESALIGPVPKFPDLRVAALNAAEICATQAATRAALADLRVALATPVEFNHAPPTNNDLRVAAGTTQTLSDLRVARAGSPAHCISDLRVAAELANPATVGTATNPESDLRVAASASSNRSEIRDPKSEIASDPKSEIASSAPRPVPRRPMRPSLPEPDATWFTQVQLATMFRTTRQNISLHIHNIFAEGKLSREDNVRSSLRVQTEGARTITRTLDHYSFSVARAIASRMGAPLREGPLVA